MHSAHIIFKTGEPPKEFPRIRTDDRNYWRFVGDESAFILVPLCGLSARPGPVPHTAYEPAGVLQPWALTDPRPFDRLEVWPVRWGFPESLLTDHASEVADLERRFLAGEFDRAFEERPANAAERAPHWETWLREAGLAILWRRHATDNMHRHWLNDADDYGLGSVLRLLAQDRADKKKTAFPTVTQDDLDRIRFRADFHLDERRFPFFLTDCKPDELTPAEVQASPAFVAEQARRIVELNQVADRLERNAGDVAKATQIADLYSDPSYMDATVAAVKRRVPKSFVEYCKSQLHGGGKFPTAGQAHRAIKTLPLLKKLRKETDQRTTCSRWLNIVHEELHKRGLVGERGPVGERGAKRASCTVEQAEAAAARVAQRTVTLEEAEDAQERGGRADRDTRAQELADPQGEP
jgi:hypothetical protein